MSSILPFLLLLLIHYSVARRAYPLGCSQKPPSYYDYEHSPFPPPGLIIHSTEDYQLVKRLGTGKFSDVFEAVNVQAERQLGTTTANNHNNNAAQSPIVVVKCLKPVSERKIRRELLVLSHASKLPNLVRLLAIVIPPEYYPNHRSPTQLARMPSLIMEHAGPNAQWLCHERNKNNDASYLSDYEIRYYLCHLLIALDALHSQGIMHRDVKPRNVLIHRLPTTQQQQRPLTLIDLGLADFYRPTQRYNVRVASRHYKSPELLIGYEYYDYGLDMWGVGCILAGLLLRREPLFRGKDNPDQLRKIIQCLGTSDLVNYMEKYKIHASPEIQQLLSMSPTMTTRQSWLSYISSDTPLPPKDGLDLLDKLLVYDHEERWTAQEALQHPFFDSVRQRVQAEVQSYHNPIPSRTTTL